MAKNKENLKGMKEGELQKKLSTLQENLRVIRFKAEGSKSKNVKESGALKKQIAQILTELNQAKKKAVK
ncbi:MAG: 50S ribosomal protein L29 [Patescibacteria group bacterium]|nr:50S ribosomal protein L29 [Patescibacteria group bacterium]